MDDWLILTSIVSLVFYLLLVIAFIRMTNDVRAIKNRIANKDSEYYRYMELAKEEHYLGNREKEREYLMRAQCRAQYGDQQEAVQNFLDMLDNKHSDNDNNAGPVTPPPTAFAENLIGR